MSHHESTEKELEEAEAELSDQDLEQVNGGYVTNGLTSFQSVRLTTWALPISVAAYVSNKESSPREARGLRKALWVDCCLVETSGGPDDCTVVRRHRRTRSH
jgi:hypothetical protein